MIVVVVVLIAVIVVVVVVVIYACPLLLAAEMDGPKITIYAGPSPCLFAGPAPAPGPGPGPSPCPCAYRGAPRGTRGVQGKGRGLGSRQ